MISAVLASNVLLLKLEILVDAPLTHLPKSYHSFAIHVICHLVHLSFTLSL